MGRTSTKPKAPLAGLGEQSHEIGKVVEVDEGGRARVQFPGAESGVLARSVLDASSRSADSAQALVGASVLLLFENGDRSLPIVVGVIRAALRPEPELPEFKLDLSRDRDVLVDGRRLVLEAQQEIELRCGKSTIILQRDGKVLIRGAHLVSRSSGPNKIKGASISLN